MANWTTGTRSCAAAIFMYKRDDSVQRVKPEIERINYEQGRVPNGCATDGICGEHHTNKAEFAAALREWNDNVQPGNAFLCIYAHSDKEGICPFYEYFDQEERKAELITWAELAQLLKSQFNIFGCLDAQRRLPRRFGALRPARSAACSWRRVRKSSGTNWSGALKLKSRWILFGQPTKSSTL